MLVLDPFHWQSPTILPYRLTEYFLLFMLLRNLIHEFPNRNLLHSRYFVEYDFFHWEILFCQLILFRILRRHLMCFDIGLLFFYRSLQQKESCSFWFILLCTMFVVFFFFSSRTIHTFGLFCPTFFRKDLSVSKTYVARRSVILPNMFWIFHIYFVGCTLFRSISFISFNAFLIPVYLIRRYYSKEGASIG